MRVKIVGIQPQKYTMDNGYSFEGKKIHALDLETVNNGQVGFITTTFRISVDSPLASIPLQVDSEYTAYFDQKGRLAFLSPYDIQKK